MCTGGSAPSAAAALPEAPSTPTSTGGETQSDRDKRRRASASGANGGTILTGSRGVTESGTTSTKTLLGQ